MKNPKSKFSRRNFLFAVGAGSAAATTALVTNQALEVQPQKQGKVGSSTGYRLTEHIQNYYRTTKV